MQTQISIAKEGKISDELYVLSRTEKVDIESLRYNIAEGKVVVLKNNTGIHFWMAIKFSKFSIRWFYL